MVDYLSSIKTLVDIFPVEAWTSGGVYLCPDSDTQLECDNAEDANFFAVVHNACTEITLDGDIMMAAFNQALISRAQGLVIDDIISITKILARHKLANK